MQGSGGRLAQDRNAEPLRKVGYRTGSREAAEGWLQDRKKGSCGRLAVGQDAETLRKTYVGRKNRRKQMLQKGKELYKKHEEIIVYLIVGVLTTIVAWAAKFIANALLFHNTMYPTPFENAVLSTINWVTGVIFAYFTNRRFVFKSKEPMRTEAPKFVLSRVSTWILDVVVMQVLTAMNINLLVATFISAVLVTVANYIFSKLFVFNKKAD